MSPTDTLIDLINRLGLKRRPNDDPEEATYRGDCPTCSGTNTFKLTIAPKRERVLFWCRNCKKSQTWQDIGLPFTHIPEDTFLTALGYWFPQGRLGFRSIQQQLENLILASLIEARDHYDIHVLNRRTLRNRMPAHNERTLRRALSYLIDAGLIKRSRYQGGNLLEQAYYYLADADPERVTADLDLDRMVASLNPQVSDS